MGYYSIMALVILWSHFSPGLGCHFLFHFLGLKQPLRTIPTRQAVASLEVPACHFQVRASSFITESPLLGNIFDELVIAVRISLV